MQREEGGRVSSIPHVTALDGARGAAVAGVVLFHGGHLAGGYLGVDFFFTLSGFLITSLLLAEAARTDSIGLGGFWARRARRLLPALVVLMIGVAVYSRLIATPTELSQIRGDALATLAYSANWRSVFAHQSYFALFSAPSPLQHTWSLAIEEQFYLIWPLVFVALLAMFSRATAKAVLITALTLTAVSTVLMFVLYSRANTNRDYYGTDTRAAAILLGVALAAWLAMRGPVQRRTSRVALEVLALGGVLVLAVAWMKLHGQSSHLYRGGFLVCGLAATIIIAAAVHPDRGPVAHALSWRPLAALGLISYGVYLYHWPLDIVLDEQRVHLSGWPLFLVQTLVTLAVAILSYKLIEQPIRKGAITARQWRRIVPAAAVVLVVGVVVATSVGAASQPAPVRASTTLRNAARAARQAPAGTTRVLIVGNSVAYYLATDGFTPIANEVKPALNVLDSSIPACYFPPELSGMTIYNPNGPPLPQPPCDPDWEAKVVAKFKPDIAIWIDGDLPSVSATYQGQPVRPCGEPYDSLYAQRLTQEVAVLGAHGARVVLTTQAYARYDKAPDDDHYTDCENNLRAEVAAKTKAMLVDLGAYTCPDRRCPVKQHGVIMRPDGLHYQGEGARVVARWIIGRVREQQQADARGRAHPARSRAHGGS